MRTPLLAAVFVAVLPAAPPEQFESRRTAHDFELAADPAKAHWKAAKVFHAGSSETGDPVPGHATEIRSLWTAQNLYILFTCAYENLYVNDSPSTENETNKLWDRDVAEAFIGSDFQTITRYKEFQVSPQGEWVDLDIDRVSPLPEGGWRWNSGYKVKARIDRDKRLWYGEMQIPWASIDARAPREGNQLRANFYRLQGPPPKRVMLSWRPVGRGTYHQPDKFGILVLTK